jgi:hypothetical protein
MPLCQAEVLEVFLLRGSAGDDLFETRGYQKILLLCVSMPVQPTVNARSANAPVIICFVNFYLFG